MDTPPPHESGGTLGVTQLDIGHTDCRTVWMMAAAALQQATAQVVAAASLRAMVVLLLLLLLPAVL